MQDELCHSAIASVLAFRWDGLERNCIASHSRKVLVPIPFRRLLGSIDTTSPVRAHEFLLLLAGDAGQSFCEAAADD